MRFTPKVKANTLLFSLVLTVAGFSLGTPVWGAESNLAPWSTEVSIEPHAEQAGAYVCKVLVRNAATGEVEAAPALVLAAGEPAEATSQGREGDRFTVRVSVNAEGTQAVYSVSVNRGEKNIEIHKGTVRLAQTE